MGHGIPSLPRSILTEFGQQLKDSLSAALVPIQEESSSQDELRDTVFREVCTSHTMQKLSIETNLPN
jgi:hypothetical protein